MLCEQNKGTVAKINLPKAPHKRRFKSQFLWWPTRMSKLNQNVSGCTADISTLERACSGADTQKMDYVISPVERATEWEFDYIL